MQVWIGVAVVALVAAGVQAAAVYESFDYTTDEELPTQTGGSGFSGAWTGPNAGYTDPWEIADATLSYSTLVVGGNAGDDTSANSSDCFRRLDMSVLDTSDGASVWFSFLMDYATLTSDLRVSFFCNEDTHGNGATVEFKGGNGTIELKGSFSGTGATSASLGSTHLYVGRVDFSDADDGDVFTLWIDPELGSTPDDGDAFLTTTGTLDMSAADYYPSVYLRAGRGAVTYVDEIRMDTTFADVTPVPEPATMALLGLGGLAVLRRRRR
jgi:hypothetical protein